MPSFVSANIKDKSGENNIWVATDFFGPGEVTITVDDFLNSGGQSASGGTTEDKSPIELGITAISLTAGGNALASDYVLTLSPYNNNTFYDATPYTGDYKIVNIMHNGVDYYDKIVKTIHNGCEYVFDIQRETYIDFLLVGGGGGGGGTNTCNQAGGGGGGGGVIYCTNFLISKGSYPITIGTGGVGGAGNLVCSGCDGGNSTFNGLTSYGGGGGGGCYKVGRNGGSGGGGGSGTKAGGTGCVGQGNNGGGGGSYGSGGGGACSEGTSSGSTVYIGGQGGNGALYNISGVNIYYGGGGGGGSYANNNHGIGGSGGGTANATCYGGGGGGGQWSCTGGEGYYGYQGIFIARYPTACGYNISGGTCYTCGDYTIHCFTSDGTLTVN